MPSPILSLVLLGLQATPPVDRPPNPIERSVVDFSLGNGWRFLLVPRAGTPIVSIETAIDVGSVDDDDGKRGLANLFAQLTMQGSERLGSTDWSEERVALSTVEESFGRWRSALEPVADDSGDEPDAAAAELAFLAARDHAREFVSPESFRRFLEDAGGVGSILVECAPDSTRYAVSLPSNQLELWCWLESERFTRPCLRSFFSERDRCLDARLRDREVAARTTLLEQLRLAAFTTHPYRHPASGYVDDLAKLRRADTDGFFRKHYGAMRMVTTIVGDFDPDRLRPLIERYFATVPTNVETGVASEPRSAEPQPTLERRISVSYAAPRLMALAWSVPPHAHVDGAAVEVTARILGPHAGSRLHQRLVRDAALATDLATQAGWPGERSANLVLVELTPLAGVEPTAIESAVEEELALLRERGPSERDLAIAQRSLVDERRRALADPEQLARLLNHYQLLGGDWRDAFKGAERWNGVSAQAVQAVVDVYFTDVRRTIALLEPKEPAAGLETKIETDGSADEGTEAPR